MYEAHTQNPQKVNVWIGILNDVIIKSFFIEGNLSADNYLVMLRNEIVLAIRNTTDDGIKPDSTKLNAITEFLILVKIKEIQAFIGLLIKFSKAIPMPNQEAAEIAKQFTLRIIFENGIPDKVLTDQGTNFVSEMFKNYYRSNRLGRIFTRADKGNVTVAIDQDEYKRQMLNMLDDNSTYTVINRDLTRKLIESVRMLSTRWKNRGYIDSKLYKKLYCSDGILPRVYGLPKIHKEGCPLRIIVSSIDNSLRYSLASFLHNIIIKNVPKLRSHIDNSSYFNSFHPRLQFTLEVGSDRLNFLDVTIINMNGKLEFNIYIKYTSIQVNFLREVSQFFYLFTLFQKRSVLMNMVDRAFLLSHPKYHTDNFKFIIKTFLDNNYPLNFIFDTINLRLRSLLKRKTLETNWFTKRWHLKNRSGHGGNPRKEFTNFFKLKIFLSPPIFFFIKS
ncbi:hypothetical protein ALC57_04673 [Trachymyrmex cornetzi]|uniref:Integrase catalytic domain-containing protein n=1 Tax=Trachymyrmex cornetzi TaxID=471704 RepID=A0A195ECE1_9HYME|nr:hypothetical protein ALC57_04673 [Trachymyrmex cornetzi]